MEHGDMGSWNYQHVVVCFYFTCCDFVVVMLLIRIFGIFWKKKISVNLTSFVKKNSPIFWNQKTLRELVLNLELWLLENFPRTSKELNTEPVKKPTLDHQFFICSTQIITTLQIPRSKKGINSHWSKSLNSQSELIAISTTSIGSPLRQITVGK